MVSCKFKQLSAISIFVLLFALALPFSSLALRIVEGTVVKVSDGDTIKVETDNQTLVKVRLAGIDTPETPKYSKRGELKKPGQPFGEEAADYLRKLVYGKRVKLEVYSVDRYHRALAFVFLGSTNVNLEIVRAGLAEVYRGKGAFGPHKGVLVQAEEEVRAAKRGMWIQGNDYESSKDFRKRMRIRGKK